MDGDKEPSRQPVIRTYAEARLSAALRDDSIRIVILDGSRGCGKSFFLRQYLDNHVQDLNQDGFYIGTADANAIHSKEDLFQIFNFFFQQLQQSENQNQRKLHGLFFLDNLLFSVNFIPTLVSIFDMAIHTDFKVVACFDIKGMLNILNPKAVPNIIRFLESYRDYSTTISVNTDLLSHDGTVNNRIVEELVQQASVDEIFLSTFKGRLNLRQLPNEPWIHFAHRMVNEKAPSVARIVLALNLASPVSGNFVKIKIALKTYYTLAPFIVVDQNVYTDTLTALLLDIVSLAVFYQDELDRVARSRLSAFDKDSDPSSTARDSLLSQILGNYIKFAGKSDNAIKDVAEPFQSLMLNLCNYLDTGFCSLDGLIRDLRTINERFFS